MAFWNKSGAQKRPVIEVIKYDGPGDILVWKFPNEDFNTKTQLIVGHSQEAVFVKGGQVLGRFIPGTYTLETGNYPFLRGLVGLATGGACPFTCAVYYINKAVSMGIDWGTDKPISVADPIYHVPIDVRSYGDFSLRVENGQKLLERLVGQSQGLSHQEIHDYFANLMDTQVRGVISGAMLEKQLSPIGIDAHLPEMSAVAMERLRPIFEPYGLAVNHFTISSISARDLDSIKDTALSLQSHRMKTDVEAEDTVKAGRATAEANRALGFSAKEQAVATIGQTLADNRGPELTGGVRPFPGVGGTVIESSASKSVDIARMLLNQQPEPPQEQKTALSFEERARQVKFLLDNNMISQERYQEKIDELMREI